MTVIEQQPFRLQVTEVLFHACPDGRKLLFVDTLVCLYVETPVVFGRNGIEGFVGFGGQHATAFAQRIIPFGFQDANFRVADAAHQVEGGIVGFTHRHHKQVAHRQDGSDGFHDRVVVKQGISDKGKTGNFHTGQNYGLAGRISNGYLLVVPNTCFAFVLKDQVM